MPQIPSTPAMPQQPVIGHKYKRPVIRAQWRHIGPNWIPVIGNIHTDSELIGADFQHAHVDYRFLSIKDREDLDRQMEADNSFVVVHAVFSTPISVVCPVGMGEMKIEDAIQHGVPEELWISTRRRAYRGPYPRYPSPAVPWKRTLSEAYQDCRLIDGLICPHQGTDLSGIEPDGGGVVTCPLHGLRWHKRSGELVMPSL